MSIFSKVYFIFNIVISIPIILPRVVMILVVTPLALLYGFVKAILQ